MIEEMDSKGGCES